MAIIRYDIEVERTVTMTATPQPGNSRHAVKGHRLRMFFLVAAYAMAAALVVLQISGVVEFQNPLADYFGNAPDDDPPPTVSPKPPVNSKPITAKPKTPPVERTDVEPAQREPEPGSAQLRPRGRLRLRPPDVPEQGGLGRRGP